MVSSMIKIEQTLWGRKFELPISCECRTDEEITDAQKLASSAILRAWDVVEGSKASVEQYCKQRDGDRINDEIENIFKYVVPSELLILHSETDRTVALMCNYRFDIDRGLAVIFKNEKLLKVVPQDEL